MKITKSMLENDASILLAAIQNHDYEIPTSKAVFSMILKVFFVMVLVQVIAVVVDTITHEEKVNMNNIIMMFLFSSASLLFALFALTLTLYGSISFALCIPKEAVKNSIICQLIKQKIRFHFKLAVIVNVIVATILIYLGPDLIHALGFSWFVMIGACSIMFSGSMSRYLTPTVMATLNKVHETITSGKQTA